MLTSQYRWHANLYTLENIICNKLKNVIYLTRAGDS